MMMSVMNGLNEVLARHDVGISAEEFLRDLDSALAEVSGPDTEPLSEVEASFLAEHGGTRTAEVIEGDARAARQQRAAAVARESTGALTSTMSITGAAALMGVDRSRISQMLSHRRLWAFSMGRNRRIPRWQFAGGVPSAQPQPCHRGHPVWPRPQSIEGLMTTERRECDGATPAEFLADGGDPHAVAALVSGLARW